MHDEGFGEKRGGRVVVGEMWRVDGLTCATACTSVDGFIPLVGAGHGEGALVHAVFAAAERHPARLQG